MQVEPLGFSIQLFFMLSDSPRNPLAQAAGKRESGRGPEAAFPVSG